MYKYPNLSLKVDFINLWQGWKNEVHKLHVWVLKRREPLSLLSCSHSSIWKKEEELSKRSTIKWGKRAEPGGGNTGKSTDSERQASKTVQWTWKTQQKSKEHRERWSPPSESRALVKMVRWFSLMTLTYKTAAEGGTGPLQLHRTGRSLPFFIIIPAHFHGPTWIERGLSSMR